MPASGPKRRRHTSGQLFAPRIWFAQLTQDVDDVRPILGCRFGSNLITDFPKTFRPKWTPVFQGQSAMSKRQRFPWIIGHPWVSSAEISKLKKTCHPKIHKDDHRKCSKDHKPWPSGIWPFRQQKVWNYWPDVCHRRFGPDAGMGLPVIFEKNDVRLFLKKVIKSLPALCILQNWNCIQKFSDHSFTDKFAF